MCFVLNCYSLFYSLLLCCTFLHTHNRNLLSYKYPLELETPVKLEAANGDVFWAYDTLFHKINAQMCLFKVAPQTHYLPVWQHGKYKEICQKGRQLLTKLLPKNYGRIPKPKPYSDKLSFNNGKGNLHKVYFYLKKVK